MQSQSWSDWKLRKQKRLISVSSRGPGLGNGGVGSIANALCKHFPEIIFVHRGEVIGEDNVPAPFVMVTRDGQTAPEKELGRLNNSELSRARLLASAWLWFIQHSDPKNCPDFQALQIWQDIHNRSEIEPDTYSRAYAKAKEAGRERELLWDAFRSVSRTVATIVHKVWMEDPCPINVNDGDNVGVGDFLVQIDPSIADWLLWHDHVPVPRWDNVPAFYREDVKRIFQGALANGIRFIGTHTPDDRRNLGRIAGELGHRFDESLMEIVNKDTGRVTRLGRTLAVVDSKFLRREGASGATCPIDVVALIRRAKDSATKESRQTMVAGLTDYDWVNRLPFVIKTDRGDDPMKNGRRFLQVVDKFFSDHPDMKGKIYFVVVGKATRTGVYVYDTYSNGCVTLFREVNAKHKKGSWQPIVWLDIVLDSAEVAQLYGHPRCRSVFVASKKDGLHLGSIECYEANAWKLFDPENFPVGVDLPPAESLPQSKPFSAEEDGVPLSPDMIEWLRSEAEGVAPAVLCLSDGCGSHFYLGHQGPVWLKARGKEEAIEQMSGALWFALTMSAEERRFRARHALSATAQFDVEVGLPTILDHAGLPLRSLPPSPPSPRDQPKALPGPEQQSKVRSDSSRPTGVAPGPAKLVVAADSSQDDGSGTNSKGVENVA